MYARIMTKTRKGYTVPIFAPIEIYGEKTVERAIATAKKYNNDCNGKLVVVCENGTVLKVR